MDGLKDGIYDKVISLDLARKLAAVKDEIDAQRTAVDSQEAVGYLSSYLKQILEICLKDIADHNEEDTEILTREIRLVNQMIGLLGKRVPELGAGNDVTEGDFLLRALEHTRNTTGKRQWIFPEIPLSQSFLFTNNRNDVSLVSELNREIASADRIDFLVSFIRFSGLSMLLPALRQFTKRGGKLRVITTTYVGATDPKAVDELARLENTEIRISYDTKGTRLHAKSYMFYRESGFSTAYLGSSNLSHAAIVDGLEWNCRVTQQDMPQIMEKMKATFETYWHADDFEPYHGEEAEAKHLRAMIDQERGRKTPNGEPTAYSFTIRPYPFQKIILDDLARERRHGHAHNLIVAATGTGKTAIAAFDYRRLFEANRKAGKPAHLLFIAHREEILKQSMSCFRQVMKDNRFGELAVGAHKPQRAEHLFMSVQTFASQRFWERMDPDFYQMIIIDEFHHAAARSYQALFSYFTPDIAVGLTATPERMDGGERKFLPYFDNRIAAEIRLPDAIERRLLCPFHYFGVEDPVDISGVSWTSGEYNVNELDNLYAIDGVSAKRRAQAIRQAVLSYTADPRDIRGLGFCVSKKHAHYMAGYMHAHGFPSAALDADSPDAERNSVQQKLERGELTFIFVVDLYNEGVDIPSVNTVLFLRPTNSLTVFLQQLGRGLRLDKGKDCLTVLDFVAQANRHYNFEGRLRAMLGRRDVVMEREIKGGFPHVPKGCYIELQEKAQDYILSNIRQQLRRKDYLLDILRKLAEERGGEVPPLRSFLDAAHLEPEVFYNGKRLYLDLCAEAGLIERAPETKKVVQFRKMAWKLLSIDDEDWLAFLTAVLRDGEKRPGTHETAYLRMWNHTIWQKDAAADPYDGLLTLRGQNALCREIAAILTYQTERSEAEPKRLQTPYPCALNVHATYSRDQLFAALGVKNPEAIREGVKFLQPGNSMVSVPTDVFLVTLNKTAKDFSDTTRYEDYSISDRLFHWQSQSTISPDSTTGTRYREQNQNGTIVLLFVRETKQDVFRRAMPYTFLGTAHIVKSEGSRPMSIIYRLDEAIPARFLRVTDTSGVL